MTAQAAHPDHLNPGLTVEAQFLAPAHGEMQTTRFVLRQEPEVAAWLLTLLDFILFRQGRIPDERRIAEPPGGEARQRLIAGAALLAGQRPDGGLALRLNPELDVRLGLMARLPGEPARTTLFALAGEPDLARWLLHWCLGETPATPQEPLAALLRQTGVLVPRLPPPEAAFPDPELPPNTAAQLATAARIFPQAAGAAVPNQVRAIIGRHTPRLPAHVPLLWLEDAGSGLAFPVLDAGAAAPLPATFRGPEAGARASAWQRQRDAGRVALKERRYTVVREIVPPAPRVRLRHYVRQLVQRGYFPALGDGQVERRAALHNEPTIASLHRGLAAIVSSLCGDTVQASYCYLGCYEAGAVLERHKDRPQCNYNLSLVLDMQGPTPAEPAPWPIYLELDGQPEAVLLEVGDGLVYSGTDIWHWREALPEGHRALVCFFHFVPGGFQGSLD